MRIRIATRGSKLARWQADWVTEELGRLHPGAEVVQELIKTKGDKIQDVPLAQIGGSGLFTKAIEEALIENRADIAVHSMKDLATEMDERLTIGAISRRHPQEDALVTKSGLSLKNLPEGATVATSSLRRRAQLLRVRPDLNIVDMRGNLDTRIKKLQESDDIDAIIVARAGMERLGFGHLITEVVKPHTILSAVGQGALAIQIRANDEMAAAAVAPLNHTETELAVRTERSFLRTLQGGCQVPIGALAFCEGGKLTLDGCVSSLDGKQHFRETTVGSMDDPEGLGRGLAERLIEQGAREILDEIRENTPITR